MLSLVKKLFFKKNTLQDFLSNPVISTNESTQIITGHVIYNQAYTYKLQLKTTLDIYRVGSSSEGKCIIWCYDIFGFKVQIFWEN